MATEKRKLAPLNPWFGMLAGYHADYFQLDEGDCSIVVPACLSPESLKDLRDRIALIMRRMERNVSPDPRIRALEKALLEAADDLERVSSAIPDDGSRDMVLEHAKEARSIAKQEAQSDA